MKIYHICLLLLSAPLLLSQAPAGGVIQGSVTFGDWAVWGKVDVPEGSYTLTVEYTYAPVKVTLRPGHGKTYVFMPTAILAGAESGHERVCLAYREDRWQVRSVDLPSLGISLLFLPGNQKSIDERSKCMPIVMSSDDSA